MAETLANRYRRWFEYEKDAHAKVLASLHSVPESQRSTSACEKAVTLLAHIMQARRVWLFRFGVLDQGPGPKDFFPTGLTLNDLAARLREIEALWSSYLQKLDDRELARVFEYQSLDGPRYRNTIEDILTQLFGHSWYHRGQIASLVRAAGGEPAITDFVFWCREPIT
jgi:uncharacterized damage-inducible protein DinB